MRKFICAKMLRNTLDQDLTKKFLAEQIDTLYATYMCTYVHVRKYKCTSLAASHLSLALLSLIFSHTASEQWSTIITQLVDYRCYSIYARTCTHVLKVLILTFESCPVIESRQTCVLSDIVQTFQGKKTTKRNGERFEPML